MSTKESWFNGFNTDYKELLVESWSPYVGAILLVLVILGLMASGLFWGVFGGLVLWGNYFNNLIGLGPLLDIPAALESPLMHRISLMDICLLLGAFSAALFSGQFSINRPPRLEYVWAALGGSLMGIGAALAGGCTTGGFLTPLIHSSPVGWSMWIGLTVGAMIGLKLLLWTLDNIDWGMQAPPTIKVPAPVRALYPFIGLLVVLAILLWAWQWYSAEDKKLVTRATLVLCGFAIGFIMHRSRLCFARAFREPFMTAEGDMTKAVILALAIAAPLASIFFQKEIMDPYLAIPASFWIGSILGGLIFGIGMIFAGGCASGTLWRMGEGHLKLWMAVFFFAWIGSIASAVLRKTGLSVTTMNFDLVEESQIGYQAFFPALLDGWGWTFLVMGAALLAWYALVRYNETTEKFTLF